MNWYKISQQIQSGIYGWYDMMGTVLPVQITEPEEVNVRGKAVTLWGMIDLSSHRKMQMWTPSAFKPDPSVKEQYS